MEEEEGLFEMYDEFGNYIGGDQRNGRDRTEEDERFEDIEANEDEIFREEER